MFVQLSTRLDVWHIQTVKAKAVFMNHLSRWRVARSALERRAVVRGRNVELLVHRPRLESGVPVINCPDAFSGSRLEV